MQQAGSTKKLHTMIQFNQRMWLKSYTDMNSKLRTEAKKNDFEKDILKLINNALKNYGKCKNAQRY